MSAWTQVPLRLLLVLSTALVASCVAVGEEGANCYQNGTCNAGLTCASNRCVVLPDFGNPKTDAQAADLGPDQSQADQSQADQSQPDQSQPDSFVVRPYPAGYGLKVGDAVENFQAPGYAATDFLCTANKDQQIDTTAEKTIALGDFFAGSSACAAQRKLLLVLVGANWCAPCAAGAKAVQAWIAGGQVSDELSVLGMMVDGPQPGHPATAGNLQAWIADHALTFPVVRSDDKFQSQALPRVVLIRTDTMQILNVWEGWGEAQVLAGINLFLTKNP